MKPIKIFFYNIITNIIFSIFHVYSYDISLIIEHIKFRYKYYYHRIKFFRNPIKFQIWFEQEMVKQNQELINDCNKILEVMNQPIDFSKVRR